MMTIFVFFRPFLLQINSITFKTKAMSVYSCKCNMSAGMSQPVQREESMYVCIHVCMSVFMFVCTCLHVCLYAYVCIVETCSTRGKHDATMTVVSICRSSEARTIFRNLSISCYLQSFSSDQVLSNDTCPLCLSGSSHSLQEHIFLQMNWCGADSEVNSKLQCIEHFKFPIPMASKVIL